MDTFVCDQFFDVPQFFVCPHLKFGQSKLGFELLHLRECVKHAFVVFGLFFQFCNGAIESRKQLAFLSSLAHAKFLQFLLKLLECLRIVNGHIERAQSCAELRF